MYIVARLHTVCDFSQLQTCNDIQQHDAFKFIRGLMHFDVLPANPYGLIYTLIYVLCHRIPVGG